MRQISVSMVARSQLMEKRGFYASIESLDLKVGDEVTFDVCGAVFESGTITNVNPPDNKRGGKYSNWWTYEYINDQMRKNWDAEDQDRHEKQKKERKLQKKEWKEAGCDENGYLSR